MKETLINKKNVIIFSVLTHTTHAPITNKKNLKTTPIIAHRLNLLRPSIQKSTN